MASAADDTRGTPERALVAVAATLMLLASTRVTLPLVVFSVIVVALALPMSGLIAWLSRFDTRPADEGEDLAPDDGFDPAAPPVVFLPADPLPRPVRPADGGVPPRFH